MLNIILFVSLQYPNMPTIVYLNHLPTLYCPAPSVQSSTTLPVQDPAVPARLAAGFDRAADRADGQSAGDRRRGRSCVLVGFTASRERSARGGGTVCYSVI